MTQPKPSRDRAIETITATRLPLLLSVPHSGRDYDAALIGASRLGQTSLERLEDPFVDLLVTGAIERGAGAVIAHAPRAAIDCNRAEGELEPASVRGRRGAAPNARARAGLGLLPTRLGTLGPLWRAAIGEEELAERLVRIHRPYHAALKQSLGALRTAYADVILLDCHSMPPRPPGEPQIVIGDRFGTSAAPWASAEAAAIARGLGFTVGHNVPFAGGHIVERHGRPAAGVHALQIEVDRALYCAADLRSPGLGFARVASLFEALACGLAGTARARWPEAAE